MPTYIYQAKTKDGVNTHGTIDAPTRDIVASQLRERGLFILRLDEQAAVRKTRSEGIAAAAIPPVGVKQRLEFWRQFQSATASGMSTSEALRMIAGPGKSHLGKILAEAADRTAQGAMLSDVLAEYSSSFPRAECALVRAGENSGTLSESVQALADMNEQELELRRMFLFQSAQPILTLVVAVFVFALIKGGPSGFLGVVANSIVPVTLGAIALFFLFRIVLATVPPIKLFWDHAKMKTPGIGSVVMRLAAAKAANVLGAGYRSGLDVSSSLELAAESCGNASMADRFIKAVPAIREGESLTSALTRTGALPSRALQFLQTGEHTGNVDAMMGSLSQYFRNEAISAIKLSAIIMGVVLLIVAGAVVLFAALSFYGGLYRGMMNGQ